MSALDFRQSAHATSEFGMVLGKSSPPSRRFLPANSKQCVGFVDFLTYMKLLYGGFHFHRTSFLRFFNIFPFRPQTLLTTHRSPAKHTTYWHRPHTSTTKLPVVFIHGIGIGLYPYTNSLTSSTQALALSLPTPTNKSALSPSK